MTSSYTTHTNQGRETTKRAESKGGSHKKAYSTGQINKEPPQLAKPPKERAKSPKPRPKPSKALPQRAKRIDPNQRKKPHKWEETPMYFICGVLFVVRIYVFIHSVVCVLCVYMIIFFEGFHQLLDLRFPLFRNA
eukprot:1064864_1